MPKFTEGLISKEDHIYDKHLKKAAVDQIADRKAPKRFESLSKQELNRLLKSKEAAIDRLNKDMFKAWEKDWQMVGCHICSIFLAIICFKLCRRRSPKPVFA